MKKLLVDIGNSFCKVALYDEQQLAVITRVPTKQGTLSDCLSQVSTQANVHSLVISSVANEEFNKKLYIDLNQLIQTPVLLIDKVAPYPGLSCIYEAPDTFGVDRWMAMIGGLSRSEGCPYYVIDFGTAINADLVDRHGKHRGGHIMPNSRLMTKALLKDTQKVNIAYSKADTESSLWGVDTGLCVSLGIDQMIVAYMERMIYTTKKQLGDDVKIFVTGEGIPATIVDALSGSVIFDPYLLLRGMLLFSEHVEEK